MLIKNCDEERDRDNNRNHHNITFLSDPGWEEESISIYTKLKRAHTKNHYHHHKDYLCYMWIYFVKLQFSYWRSKEQKNKWKNINKNIAFYYTAIDYIPHSRGIPAHLIFILIIIIFVWLLLLLLLLAVMCPFNNQRMSIKPLPTITV